MVVIILESVNTRLRGELRRWLIEPHTGVFVGHISAMVRDRLWERCCRECCEGNCQGGVVQLWNTNNEQHFQMRMYGYTTRRIIEMEGLQLIESPPPQKTTRAKKKKAEEEED